MKFIMYSAMFWMAICLVAIRMYKEKILKNGWAVRAPNSDPVLNLVLFVLMMFIPILRIYFFGMILYMAGTREQDSDI